MEALTFLLLLLCVGIAGSSAVDLQKRIYGGYDCDPNERKYYVALSKNPDGKSIYCGGSLIPNQWVVTAAHCKKDKMYVVLGVHGGTKHIEEITDKHTIHRHEDFDMMFLKLQTATTITPVPVPSAADCKKKPVIGQSEVNVAGHGNYLIDPKTRVKLNSQPDKLQCVDLNVVNCNFHPSLKECAGVNVEHYFCGSGDEKDVGAGDSGTGVVHNKILYGIHKGSDRVACSQPAAFVDICSFIEKHGIPK